MHMFYVASSKKGTNDKFDLFLLLTCCYSLIYRLNGFLDFNVD